MNFNFVFCRGAIKEKTIHGVGGSLAVISNETTEILHAIDHVCGNAGTGRLILYN